VKGARGGSRPLGHKPTADELVGPRSTPQPQTPPAPRSKPLGSVPEPPIPIPLDDKRARAASVAAEVLAAAAAQRRAAAPPSLVDKSANSTVRISRWCVSPRGWVQVHCGHGSALWVPQRCRRCSGCAEAYRARVRARVLAGLEEAQGERCGFLTLTSTPGTSLVEFMKAWNRFRGWLRRRLPGCEYAAVKEFGSSTGMLHLHVVIRGWRYIAQAELSRVWERYSGAFRVDIRAVKDEDGAADYMAKYVAKAVATVRARKVVTYSRGWGGDSKAGMADWFFSGDRRSGAAVPFVAGARRAFRSGAVVAVDRHCECIEEARLPGWEAILRLDGLVVSIHAQRRE